VKGYQPNRVKAIFRVNNCLPSCRQKTLRTNMTPWALAPNHQFYPNKKKQMVTVGTRYGSSSDQVDQVRTRQGPGKDKAGTRQGPGRDQADQDCVGTSSGPCSPCKDHVRPCRYLIRSPYRANRHHLATSKPRKGPCRDHVGTMKGPVPLTDHVWTT
jgi:hypothetical protein